MKKRLKVAIYIIRLIRWLGLKYVSGSAGNSVLWFRFQYCKNKADLMCLLNNI